MTMINVDSFKVHLDAAHEAHKNYMNQPKHLDDAPLSGVNLEDYKRQSSLLLEAYNDACRALFTALSTAVNKEC